jgi:hypothetical protein
MKYIFTQKMITGPFTKPISIDVFNRHVKSLGLHRYWCINVKYFFPNNVHEHF